MAENLYKRQTAGDAKWLSALARLNRRGGHGDISNEVVIGDDWKEAIAKLLWALSQLQRGCQNPILGLRAECWAPEAREAFIPIRPLQPQLEGDELLHPNHTYYVHTAGGAVTRWLEDATLSDGEVIEVKDVDGSAATNNITIKTVKSQTIDGASTLTITANYGSVQIRSNGQQWYTVANKSSADTAGSGDVVGPASADDNAVARFDTTTGKLIQNSELILDDVSGGYAKLHTKDNGAGDSNGLRLDVGTATGTAGGVQIGNSNATSVDIASSGVTTTIKGPATCELTLASKAHTNTTADGTVARTLANDATHGEKVLHDEVTTTDATVTTVIEFALPADAVSGVTITVIGRETPGTDNNSHRRYTATYEEDAATLTMVDSQLDYSYNPGALPAVTIDTNGANGRVRVEGVGTIRWHCKVVYDWRTETA